MTLDEILLILLLGVHSYRQKEHSVTDEWMTFPLVLIVTWNKRALSVQNRALHADLPSVRELVIDDAALM